MTTRVELKEGADVELAARLARGDAGALEEVIELHRAGIVRLANRLLGWSGEVDDIVQDIFLTALQKSSGFRGQSSLKTWLTVITLNRCRTYHRRRKIWRRVLTTLTARRSLPSPAADQPALSDEVAREVRSAVAALPSRDREVIVLLYLEHKSPAEIAGLMGSSLNAIEVRLHRAKAKLRQSLQSLMKE
jgi:RNA polymerase sigma-70 factor (ECF subfamily)